MIKLPDKCPECDGEELSAGVYAYVDYLGMNINLPVTQVYIGCDKCSHTIAHYDADDWVYEAFDKLKQIKE